MKISLRLIENLKKILRGESVSYSILPESLTDFLVNEGLLNVEYHGTRRSLRTHNAEALAGALRRYHEALSDLDAATVLLTKDSSRAAQAAISGNSKTCNERSCPGFLVNTYRTVNCMLNDREFKIEPADGTAIYIADWKTFVPPSEAVIVGVENMENFLKIRSQKKLFKTIINDEEIDVIFVARYAFSLDLVNWLKSIPNQYVHFGDFDLAGINIFLTQFKPYVGERGSFLIPPDIEERLSHGSQKRYDDQYQKYPQITTSDSEINRLIALIHHFRRSYDQEGYINSIDL